MRLIDANALNKTLQKRVGSPTEDKLYEVNLCIIDAPTIDAVPVVRCIDCKHRPIVKEIQRNVYHVVSPDDVCPFGQVEDFIQIMPEDDFFCANGEMEG